MDAGGREIVREAETVAVGRRVQIGVGSDHQVELSVVVGVKQQRARIHFARLGFESGLFRDVGESSVAVVLVEVDASETHHKQAHLFAVVIVRESGGQSMFRPPDAGLGRDVRESPAAAVVEKLVFAAGIGQVKIGVGIAVKITHRDGGTHQRKKFCPGKIGRVIRSLDFCRNGVSRYARAPQGNAQAGGDVAEGDGTRRCAACHAHRTGCRNQDLSIPALFKRRGLQRNAGELVAVLLVELQHLLGFRPAAHPHQKGESAEQGSDVKILAALESHPVHVLVSVKSQLHFAFGKVDGAQVEPCGRIVGVGGDDPFEGFFSRPIVEFALVEDCQVVIHGDKIGGHLFGGGQRGERLVEVVRLRVSEAQVQVVGGEGMAGLDDLLKFVGGLRVLALLVVRLAQVAPGLQRCPAGRAGLRHGSCGKWLRRARSFSRLC